ncbi:MAG: peptide chain release factor 1 [Christensenellaceae bacterium]|jgi:peptide chain release factor 1|nr:peptide chain release factor 1 [Christensenellaceae bacterium]
MLEKIKEIRERFEENEREMQSEKAMLDLAYYTKLSRVAKQLRPIIACADEITRLENDIESSTEILTSETDAELLEMARAEIDENEKKLAEENEKLKMLLIPKDERDDNNVIVEIRPAAGGDESGLFGAELLRMYSLYAQKCGLKVEINEVNETEIGGIKDASFMIIGEGAFAIFKYESGVHRVQRVPDTETQGRVHTSTCTVAVLPEAVDVNFVIDEKDLRIDVYRASGAGGQHINRTESAVRITHIPTNTVVTCQDGRSQIQNKARAMLVLQTKLADMFQSKADKEYSDARHAQIGSGDRSERIRTYNFPQGRLTDHRINYTSYNLPAIMNGDLTDLTEALKIADMNMKLQNL